MTEKRAKIGHKPGETTQTRPNVTRVAWSQVLLPHTHRLHRADCDSYVKAGLGQTRSAFLLLLKFGTVGTSDMGDQRRKDSLLS